MAEIWQRDIDAPTNSEVAKVKATLNHCVQDYIDAGKFEVLHVTQYIVIIDSLLNI